MKRGRNISMDSSEHIRLAVYQELQNAVKIRKVNCELLEHLLSSVRWILHYARKNNISLPDIDKIEQVIDRAIEIDEKAPV
jgi:hypothetical protein